MRNLKFVLRWALTGLGIAFLVISIDETDWLDRVFTTGLMRTSFAAAAKRATPAVVSIRTAIATAEPANPLLRDPLLRQFFGVAPERGQPRFETSLGSGVIVDRSGYVLTNYHVIRDAQQIQVAVADGRRAAARVVGVDPDTDLAVLKLELEDLPVVVIGNSDDLQVGDVVLAIGNPLGVGQTVTQGIISATGRDHVGINTIENFIQTDAAINPGNSGGALIDTRGALVGINSAILGVRGISFAIPTSIAVDIMRQLIATGSVVRGWLGVDARDLTPMLREQLGIEDSVGIIVMGVLPNGPAAQAGLQPGDVITDIGKQPLADSREAVRFIAGLRPGSKVELGIVRNGKPQRVVTEVAQRPQLARE